MIAARTKKVSLTFVRSELLYDISNIAWVEGDVMQVDDEHARHQLIDVCEDGNVDRVTRVLNLGIARCAELLYPYSKLPVEPDTYMVDALEEPEAYTIDLLVPDDFSQTTVNYLEHLIHELLVCMVIVDWLGMTKKESKTNWQEKIEGLERAIKATLSARVGRVRKTLAPW